MHKSSLLKNQNAVTKLEKTGNKEQMTSAFGARYPSLRVIPLAVFLALLALAKSLIRPLSPFPFAGGGYIPRGTATTRNALA